MKKLAKLFRNIDLVKFSLITLFFVVFFNALASQLDIWWNDFLLPFFFTLAIGMFVICLYLTPQPKKVKNNGKSKSN